MNENVERCWLTPTLAVNVAQVDFLDPALAHVPRARERGVRVEIRPATAAALGSVYASPVLSLGPAVCRIDLLESAPHAADRMHWHPAMVDGEPEDRCYDAAMSADPAGWLGEQLRNVLALLKQAGVSDLEKFRPAAPIVAQLAPEIVEAARKGLIRAREPWPEVHHDGRGMAEEAV